MMETTHKGSYLKYNLASCLILYPKSFAVIFAVGMKNGDNATDKYNSWTALKKALTESSPLPSCSNKNLVLHAVVKADTCKLLNRSTTPRCIVLLLHSASSTASRAAWRTK